MAGLEPKSARFKVFDAVVGRRYFTRWLEESLEGMRRAARERSAPARDAG